MLDIKHALPLLRIKLLLSQQFRHLQSNSSSRLLSGKVRPMLQLAHLGFLRQLQQSFPAIRHLIGGCYWRWCRRCLGLLILKAFVLQVHALVFQVGLILTKQIIYTYSIL